MSKEGQLAKLAGLLQRVQQNASVSRDATRKSGVSWSAGAAERPQPAVIETPAVEAAVMHPAVAEVQVEPLVAREAPPEVEPPPVVEVAPASGEDVEVEIDMSGSESPVPPSAERRPLPFATEPAPPPVDALPRVILAPDSEPPPSGPVDTIPAPTFESEPPPPHAAPESPIPPVAYQAPPEPAREPVAAGPALDLQLTPGPGAVAAPPASVPPPTPAEPMHLDIPERTVQPDRGPAEVAAFVGQTKQVLPATFGDILDVTIALGG